MDEVSSLHQTHVFQEGRIGVSHRPVSRVTTLDHASDPGEALRIEVIERGVRNHLLIVSGGAGIAQESCDFSLGTLLISGTQAHKGLPGLLETHADGLLIARGRVDVEAKHGFAVDVPPPRAYFDRLIEFGEVATSTEKVILQAIRIEDSRDAMRIRGVLALGHTKNEPSARRVGERAYSGVSGFWDICLGLLDLEVVPLHVLKPFDQLNLYP